MDIQTLKPIFLDYFYEQMRKKEEIEIDSLVSMAQNVEIAAKTIDELLSEGLIEGVSIIWNDEHPLFQSSHDAKLTEKGVKQVARKNAFTEMFPDEKINEEIVKGIKKGQNDKKKLTVEDLLNKVPNKKSSIKKQNYAKIEKDILVLFDKFKNDSIEFIDKKITPYLLQVEINKIAKQYYKDYRPVISKIIADLNAKGIINYKYGDRNPKLDLKELITDKGIKYLEETYSYCFNKPLGEMTEEEFNNTFGNPVTSLSKALLSAAGMPSISPQIKQIAASINSVKAIQGAVGVNPSILKLAQQMAGSDYLKAAQSAISSGAMQAASEALKIQGAYGNAKSKKKEDNYSEESSDNEFTFEGILGQNCGDYIEITKENDNEMLPDRIRNPKTGKRFIVPEHIPVLRGFAKASDLFRASQKDDNYQREPKKIDLDNIELFITDIKPQARYFPELTFVIRGGYNLSRPELSDKLKGTTKGEFDNLEYYKINFDGQKLYRIDGNHRLNALNSLSVKNKDYYVPFAIILWGNRIPFKNEKGEIIQDDYDFQGYYGELTTDEEQKYIDNEAFLFYFLNSKAKKLTTEENLKGLVNAETWEPHELSIANKNITLLKYLQDQINNNTFVSSYLCKNKPLKEISEILEKIKEDIDIETFKSAMTLTNELLILDQWQELKRFKFYCQLLFYIAYIDKTKDKAQLSLSQINRWVKKYKFDGEVFDNPISLYKNAEKTNHLNSIKIFIAMPYYGDDEIDDFNDQFEKLREEIIKKHPSLENRLVIFEIMRHRGFAIDIQEQIINQIKESNIFIADISEHTIKKDRKSLTSHANPNVMYELGLAKNQKHTEIILLKNKNDKTTVPSDLITKYHNKFDMANKSKVRKKIIEAIEDILKNKFEVI